VELIVDVVIVFFIVGLVVAIFAYIVGLIIAGFLTFSEWIERKSA
jgi:hypothetical protein